MKNEDGSALKEAHELLFIHALSGRKEPSDELKALFKGNEKGLKAFMLYSTFGPYAGSGRNVEEQLSLYKLALSNYPDLQKTLFLESKK